VEGALRREQDLAGALHEVSNALTVILGWVERARGAQGDDLARALDIVSSRARDARRIVRGAIGASAEGLEGPASIRVATRALRDVIEDAVTALDPEASRASIRVEAVVDASVGAYPVHASTTLLQILTNLLLNALAMSPHGGVVQVDAAPEGGVVVIGVSDEGPGIPPERRATLLRSGVSTRVGGAGIGLRHSAALAEAAGARLSLGSSVRGARFEVRWPMEGALMEGPPSSGPGSAPSRGPGLVLDGVRILVVEDDDAVVDLLDTALTARGATIVSVREVNELPGVLASGRFDAALLDISPIKEDVQGTMAAVQSASPGARLVVMSGSGTIADLPRDSGAFWVRKPFEVREIVDALVR
jgi:CheY-like chemotaxis protein